MDEPWKTAIHEAANMAIEGSWGLFDVNKVRQRVLDLADAQQRLKPGVVIPSCA